MSKGRTLQLASHDVSVAFFHAWLERGVWVKTPKDLRSSKAFQESVREMDTTYEWTQLYPTVLPDPLHWQAHRQDRPSILWCFCTSACSNTRYVRSHTEGQRTLCSSVSQRGLHQSSTILLLLRQSPADRCTHTQKNQTDQTRQNIRTDGDGGVVVLVLVYSQMRLCVRSECVRMRLHYTWPQIPRI